MVVTSAVIWQRIPRLVSAPDSSPHVNDKYCHIEERDYSNPDVSLLS